MNLDPKQWLMYVLGALLIAGIAWLLAVLATLIVDVARLLA